MIDLHTHTNASDGSLSPAELVHHATRSGIEAIAVTDHDTIGGIAEALDAGEREGIEVIPGLEISAEFNPGTLHMLGLFLDHESAILKETLTGIQRGRAERNPRILNNLADMGFPFTMDEVMEIAGDGQVGRPHIAQTMLKRGYVSSTQEAFDKYLKKGAPAYVDRHRLSPVDAIELIHAAGGIAVIAHPATLSVNGMGRKHLFRSMKDAGMDGLEVYYSSHTGDDIDDLHAAADEYGFLISGGTDFHGDSKPSLKIGVGYGNMAIPYIVLEEMKRHAGLHI